MEGPGLPGLFGFDPPLLDLAEEGMDVQYCGRVLDRMRARVRGVMG